MKLSPNELAKLARQYATYHLHAEQYLHNGHGIPLDLMNSLQGIAAQINSQCTPQQQIALDRYANQSRQRQLQKAEQFNRDVEKAHQIMDQARTEEFYRGAYNQTSHGNLHHAAALRGQNYVIKGRKKKAVPSDNEMQFMTKAVDPRGKGFSWHEFNDILTDMNESNNPERVLKSYGITDVDHWKKIADGYADDVIRGGLQDRDEPDTEVTVTASDQRRAHIIEAARTHKDPSVLAAMVEADDIPDHIRNETDPDGSPSTRASLAAAFDAHEPESELDTLSHDLANEIQERFNA